jgi:hypothetical protein
MVRMDKIFSNVYASWKGLQVLRKRVCRSKCVSSAIRKILLIVGKAFMFLLVIRMAKAFRNKMKEVGLV